MLETIFTTLARRPYIVAFLLAYLFLSIRRRGFFPTLVFLITGYFIAWLSEASSIRTGFPYGWYFYRYEALQGEWLNWGVPVWDSVSYVFLCFAGLCVAEDIFFKKMSIFPASLSMRELFRLTFLSAILVTLLDIIVDPLAHRGDLWFLGNIYYYPHPGFYFNVPLSNFCGWFLVSFCIIGLNFFLEKILKIYSLYGRSMVCSYWFDLHGGALLYFSIFLFNGAIAIWIHAWDLVLASSLWILVPRILFLKPPAFFQVGSKMPRKTS